MLDEGPFTGLEGVRHLDVRLEWLHGIGQLDGGENAMRCFRDFWTQAAKVEHLVVGGFHRGDFPDANFTSTLLGCRWPLLRNLELGNMRSGRTSFMLFC